VPEMSNLNIWEIVWGALGGAGAALIVLRFLSRKLIDHFLAKDIENYKATLKAENDERLKKMELENARELEKIRLQLAVSKAEGDALREYKYGALKRLYEEYEPVKFHLIEACENAVSFISRFGEESLGKHNVEFGALPGGNYKRIATIYNLLIPTAYFRIVRRRLTLIDLDLSPEIRLQYRIARQIYFSFTDDANIAQIAGIRYTPYVEKWKEKRVDNPTQYRRQGFALGRLDNALDSIICSEEKGERPLTFGEFELLLKEVPSDDYAGPLGTAVDLFDEFDPHTRPVLWRILLIHYFFYLILIDVSRKGKGTEDIRSILCTAVDRAKDFSVSEESFADLSPVETALSYVKGVKFDSALT
jgi:hypothetical protein